MDAVRALQIARIPLLVVLLAAASPFLRAAHRVASRGEVGGIWSAWLPLVVLAVAFVALMHLGRRRRHPWVTLVGEALVAGVLGFVPAVAWIVWFGIHPWTRLAGGDSSFVGLMQPLAIAWLGVVIVAWVKQTRRSEVA